jgi:hypothetical protein
MAINDQQPIPEVPVTDYGFDPVPQRSPLQRFWWLLIPFLLGLVLLGLGISRLHRPAPPTAAENIATNCQYSAAGLTLSADDEAALVSTAEQVMPTVGNDRARAITAAKNICIAHLCGANAPQHTDLGNIAAEEFAWVGTLITDTTANFLANEFSSASWCTAH